MSKDLRLTKEQRELAASNHNLIYSFAHKKNIPIDDYYGILAIGLCNAAKIYDKHKNKFSTLAYRCMENELNMHWRNANKKSVIPYDAILYYDAPIGTDNSKNKSSFSENFPDNKPNDSMMYAIISAEFIDKLTDKERMIVQFLVDGMTHSEIAQELKCKRQNIGYHVKQIRNKAIDYFDY